jgi:SAM-dependent methyltransferase
MAARFSDINASKANFDDIYVMDDPRGYFSVLGSLDYMIPDVAEPVIRQILTARAQRLKRRPQVLDIGCSYGINAAVHRFPLTFGTLRSRYARREMMAVSAEEVARLDCNFYASWPDTGVARFIGLDVSEPAIRYAKQVGLIDKGVVADLERDPLTPAAADIIRQADVLLSTGAVGYVTERTYRSLLGTLARPPWVVSFVLRMFPYEEMQRTLDRFGLVTEHLAGVTFVQRRFRDIAEFERSLGALADRGVDTAGFEADGLFQADLYVSRPREDVQAARLDEIVTVTSGRNRPVGTRYVQVETDEGMQIGLEP